MTTNLSLKLARLQEDVLKTDYYPEYYRKVLATHQVTEAEVRDCKLTDRQVSRIANDFWFRLPDSPVIRTPVFFQLCDIAADAPDEEP